MDLRLTAGALALALSYGCLPNDFSDVEQSASPDPDAGTTPRSDAEVADPVDGSSGRPEVPPDGGPSDGSTNAAPDGSSNRNDAGPDGGTTLPDGGSAECTPPTSGGRALRASMPVEVGRLAKPAMVDSRRAGPSAVLGDKHVWLMSTTKLASGLKQSANLPNNYPAWALDGADRPWTRAQPGPSAPIHLAEVLAPSGLPQPMFSLPVSEQAMDMLLVPTSLVRRSAPATGGLAFVEQTRGFAYPEAIWTATVPEGGGAATRAASPLFKKPEPLFAWGAYRGKDYLSIYACSDADHKCVMARAPVDKIEQHDAYEVRTESGWSRDLTKGATVIEGPWLDLSVSYNEYLGKYVAVHGESLANVVVLQTAPAPEGPWTKAATLPLPAPPVWPAWSTTYVREHESLTEASPCGRRLFITHWAPARVEETKFPGGGEVVLSAIDLQ